MELELSSGTELRLRVPGEIEVPYVIESSVDLEHWSTWLDVDYPWRPVDLELQMNELALFFRARAAP
jgi:hypothetical protein